MRVGSNYSWFVTDVIKNFKLTYILTKFLHNVDSPVLKGLWKFQPDKPIKVRVTAVQSLENLYTFILR